MNTFFDRCYCVNLDRRPDRWEAFSSRLTDWPFAPVERWQAVDGQRVPHPDWWYSGKGAWGCLRSHAGLIEKCLNEGAGNVLLMEDDAVLCENFTARVTAFLDAVPANWGMLYLGGQHLFAATHPPKRINDLVCRPYNVNRTHAFAISRAALPVIYKHLHKHDWRSGHHIDHHLGRIHMNQAVPVYCPAEWLVGQDAGKSDISNRTPDLRFWQPEHIAQTSPKPFVAIVGLHSSGSSVVAGICHALGLNLGDKLVGYYPVHPIHRGYEARGLAQLCETVCPFPTTIFRSNPERRLEKWIAQRVKAGKKRGVQVGGKYPTLCRLGLPLQTICGDRLTVVHCSRPLEESIASLQRRQADKDKDKDKAKGDPGVLEELQRWLWDGKQEILANVPAERQITVEYENLLSDPVEVVLRLAGFLNLNPPDKQLDQAIALVKPDQRHVNLQATAA